MDIATAIIKEIIHIAFVIFIQLFVAYMWFRLGLYKGHYLTFNKTIDNIERHRGEEDKSVDVRDILPYLNMEEEARKWRDETLKQFKWLLITKPIEICSTRYALIKERLWRK